LILPAYSVEKAEIMGFQSSEGAALDMVEAGLIDPGTGALSAKGLHQRIDAELERAKLSRATMSLVMISLHQFDEVVLNAGAEAGELFLRRMVAACRTCLRSSDSIGRIDAHFVIILPEIPERGGQRVAERLLSAVQSISVARERDAAPCGLRLGVASMSGIDRIGGLTAAQAIARAEQAMLTEPVGNDHKRVMAA
jgi:diguanylate cyclase (GGDEF)-like protein